MKKHALFATAMTNIAFIGTGVMGA
ncbi:MAG: hypothetical protein JWN66_4555, partial [Sphingomonas bacterium]|nr:hypothetical protein [Sphingomonas bacterium]